MTNKAKRLLGYSMIAAGTILFADLVRAGGITPEPVWMEPEVTVPVTIEVWRPRKFADCHDDRVDVKRFERWVERHCTPKGNTPPTEKPKPPKENPCKATRNGGSEECI
jgi:hypothetical protein